MLQSKACSAITGALRIIAIITVAFLSLMLLMQALPTPTPAHPTQPASQSLGAIGISAPYASTCSDVGFRVFPSRLQGRG